ncbi:MAG: hypothetical protein ACLFOY_19445, partial [Desulfatibacillaceae bacterium]
HLIVFEQAVNPWFFNGLVTHRAKALLTWPDVWGHNPSIHEVSEYDAPVACGPGGVGRSCQRHGARFVLRRKAGKEASATRAWNP